MNPPPEQISDKRRLQLRITDDEVNVPPRSCAFVAVVCDDPCIVDGLSELHTSLFLDHGFAVTRGLVQLSGDRGNLLLANFASERRSITKGTMVVFFESVDDAEGCFLLQTSSTITVRAKLAIDVNHNLPSEKHRALLDLLQHYEDCFRPRAESVRRH